VLRIGLIISSPLTSYTSVQIRSIIPELLESWIVMVLEFKVSIEQNDESEESFSKLLKSRGEEDFWNFLSGLTNV